MALEVAGWAASPLASKLVDKASSSFKFWSHYFEYKAVDKLKSLKQELLKSRSLLSTLNGNSETDYHSESGSTKPEDRCLREWMMNLKCAVDTAEDVVYKLACKTRGKRDLYDWYVWTYAMKILSKHDLLFPKDCGHVRSEDIDEVEAAVNRLKEIMEDTGAVIKWTCLRIENGCASELMRKKIEAVKDGLGEVKMEIEKGAKGSRECLQDILAEIKLHIEDVKELLDKLLPTPLSSPPPPPPHFPLLVQTSNDPLETQTRKRTRTDLQNTDA